MKKDFITATPDSGESGSTTVTATASANQTESTRSTSLSVAGGGMTRTVGASQAAGVVTWNYYFSVTPTSLSFVAGGETKAVTVSSYRKKAINGVETSTQENVNWTPTVSGTGFSVSGSNVTAAANSAATTRSGTATYTQTGSGKTQAVSLSQAAGVVTWNYYFSVTPTSLSFVAGGETKAVTVSSYRKKAINGVETSTQENVNWTPTVSGTGFSVSGSNVTAAANSAATTRSGTATYTQTGSGKTQAVSLSQAAASVTYKYRIEPTLITVSNTTYGSVTKTVTMYKETYINGVKQSEEPIPYSLLKQNSGYSPVSSATYTNSWGGTWTIEKSGNSLKVTTISGGSNSSGGITGVKLMPGTSYAGAINTNLNLVRP